MSLQNYIFLVVFLGVVISATATVGFGAEPFIESSFANSGTEVMMSSTEVRGHITDIEWTKVVTSNGVIGINEITFTMVNEDENNSHVFQVCAVIKGPPGVYISSIDTPPECTTTDSIAALGTQTNQSIPFAAAINVTDIIDISITIEEKS